MMTKMKAIATVIALGVASTPALADHHEHKQAIPKIMAGANAYEETLKVDDAMSVYDAAMATYAVGFEYEFTPTVGAELRHYFGGEEKLVSHTDESKTNHYAEMEGATALLLNLQTPKLWGFSAYVQGGPAMAKNSLDGNDYSNNSFAYGAGIEFEIKDDMFIFIDALQFNEYDIKDSKVGSVKNRLGMFGFAMQF